MKPKIAICGPGRAGKDEAADFLVSRGWRYGGSTSVVITREVARREGISIAAAHAQRHARRDDWFRIGNELRSEHGPAHLAREVLKEGDLVVGVRSLGEILEVRRAGLVDLIVWIDRPGLPADPTLEYGQDVADAIIPNHGTLSDYLVRLARLVYAMDRAAEPAPRPAPTVFDLFGDLGIPLPRGGDGAADFSPYGFPRLDDPPAAACVGGGPNVTDPSPLASGANVGS